MSVRVVETVLAAALAGSGTLTLNYPAGTAAGDFTNTGGHAVVTGTNDAFESGKHFTVAWNAASFVITWLSTSPTLPVGTKLFVQINMRGANGLPSGNQLTGAQARVTQEVPLYCVRLGSPAAFDDDDICVAQAISGTNAVATLNGAKVVGGVAISDCPTGRNIVVDSSGAGDTTQTVRIRGYDCLGNKVTETIALNGTTGVVGTKAFLRVTQVIVSATMAGNLFVGFGVVFGLPLFLGAGGHVLFERRNGAAPTAGTFVAGNQAAAAIATGADVRGTYSPNSAPNGTDSLELFIFATEPGYLGQPQFSDF
jgi:hypothetical protein